MNSIPADLFIDTNILVYAHDVDAGAKHERARDLIARLWRSEPLPWLSVQVLQELAVSLRRRNVPFAEIREIVADYSCWRVVENTTEILNASMTEMERWQLSPWEALIISAARKAGARLIWSEDFGDGQDYGGIRVVDPLKSAAADT
jgi:predicted nucleic acid-binding protein